MRNKTNTTQHGVCSSSGLSSIPAARAGTAARVRLQCAAAELPAGLVCVCGVVCVLRIFLFIFLTYNCFCPCSPHVHPQPGEQTFVTTTTTYAPGPQELATRERRAAQQARTRCVTGMIFGGCLIACCVGKDRAVVRSCVAFVVLLLLCCFFVLFFVFVFSVVFVFVLVLTLLLTPGHRHRPVETMSSTRCCAHATVRPVGRLQTTVVFYFFVF